MVYSIVRHFNSLKPFLASTSETPIGPLFLLRCVIGGILLFAFVVVKVSISESEKV